MRYLFIDRILRIEANRSIVAVKNVALSEDVFTDHFPGRPIMPGALLIEALAQAGTALIEVSHQMRYKAMLIMVQNAKFRVHVRPGDQLRIEADLISVENRVGRIEGSIYVDQNLVMNGELTFALKDADEIYLPPVRTLIESQYKIWLAGADMIGFGATEKPPDV